MLTKTRKLNNKEISQDRKKAFEDSIIEWTQFFRANPHRFITDYLGLPLFIFQMIIIYMFDKFNYNMLTCSRGTGKSYITAVYSCCRCILYPHTKIVIGASTKGQAKLLISEKIEKDIYVKSANLRREIKEIKCNGQEAKVIFHNGSTIEAVVSGEQSRGYRCNILIIDEFRLVSKEVTDRIMRPFLNVNRQPLFTKKTEYEGYPVEENKEIYLSSCYFKSTEAYEKFAHYVKAMLRGEDYFVLNTEYNLAIHHGLLSRARAEAMRKEMDSVSWAMEMESLWWGENESAFFKSHIINPCRVLTRPFYPPTNLEYLTAKKKGKKYKSNIPKVQGEIRILGADIALAKGKQNDNAVYTLMRLLPNSGSFEKQVVYIESHNGLSQEKQAIRIKQLFYDFQTDFMIIDTQGVGTAVWGELQKIQYDSDRDEDYPAFTCFNEDNTVDKMMARNALPVVYSLKPTTLKINNDIALWLREAFVSKTLKLPINDIEARDLLIETEKDFLKKPPSEQALLQLPYVQTTALVNELINLEYSTPSNMVKVVEVGTARKDRYSSLAYTNFLADLLEKEEKKKRGQDRNRIFAIWG